jgi:ArsR family transcriptional regulator
MNPQIAADVFKALSVPSRMRILMLLKSEGPLPVKSIAEDLGMTSPAVSQHLKVLRHVGLVRAERQGYWVPYSVNAEALSDSCGMIVRVCACSGCREEASESRESESETEILLRRRDELLSELQRIEGELDDLRGG